jgi:hypothetical protein
VVRIEWCTTRAEVLKGLADYALLTVAHGKTGPIMLIDRTSRLVWILDTPSVPQDARAGGSFRDEVHMLKQEAVAHVDRTRIWIGAATRYASAAIGGTR